MIEIGKQYTRNGTPVRILCVDAPGVSPVIVIADDGSIFRHHSDGSYYRNSRECDLIEVRPTIKKTYWLAHYRDGGTAACRSKPTTIICTDRLAITGPHEVEFKEGDGL